MKHNFARTLSPGDLILVPYQNHLYPGIFKGYGKSGGNVHYFGLKTNDEHKDYIRKRLQDGKKPYVDFINRRGSNVIAKLNPNEMEATLRVWYDEYKFLLTQKGII